LGPLATESPCTTHIHITCSLGTCSNNINQENSKQNSSMRYYILTWCHSRLKSCGMSHHVTGRAVPGVPRDRGAFTIRVKMKATQMFRTPGTTHPTTQYHIKDNLNLQQHQCSTSAGKLTYLLHGTESFLRS